MSRHDKQMKVWSKPLAPHLAGAARYPTARLVVDQPCAYCNRPAAHAFNLPRYGRPQIFLCHEHKGHEQQ